MKDKKKIVEVAKSKKIEDANIEKNDDLRNKIIIVLVGIIVLIFICFGIKYVLNNPDTVSDGIKFKEEYEKLNNTEVENTNYKYLELSIDEDNQIKYSSYEEVFDILDNGSGIIYFGFPECPWCRALTPVLLVAADDVGIDTIYYLNNREDRDLLELDENNQVVVKEEGSDNYYKLLDKLGDFASDYELEDVNTNKKRLYFPTVLFVKDGEIIDFHEGTIESQENPFVELTQEDKDNLEAVLEEKIEKVITCSGAC